MVTKLKQWFTDYCLAARCLSQNNYRKGNSNETFVVKSEGRQPPPHSFQTSFYLFGAVWVPIGFRTSPKQSSVYNRQFLLKQCKHQISSMQKYLSEMNLTKIKRWFVKNIHSFPNLSHYICHFNSIFLTMGPKHFQTLHSSDFYFSNL